MNVPFWLNDESLNAAFLAQAKEAGLLALEGHRIVGGMRASIYNAMPLAGVQALVDFMAQFAKEHSSNTLLHCYFVQLRIQLELLIQWRSVGKTPVFDLQRFRQQLGVEEIKYSRMSDFKKYVLDFAVQQINEHTDITVKYDQHKQGRIITGFTFNFKVKAKPKKALESKRDSNTPDMLTVVKMTDKQRGAFASKLSQMSELSSYAKQGEDYKQFAERIETELLDEKKQVFYIPYLEKLGFQPC